MPITIGPLDLGYLLGAKLDIWIDRPEKLAVGSRGSPLVFDGRRRKMFKGSKEVGTFEKVRRIVITESDDDEGRPYSWTVSLDLGGWFRYKVGVSRDQFLASQVAARISTITGKEVVVG